MSFTSFPERCIAESEVVVRAWSPDGMSHRRMARCGLADGARPPDRRVAGLCWASRGAGRLISLDRAVGRVTQRVDLRRRSGCSWEGRTMRHAGRGGRRVPPRLAATLAGALAVLAVLAVLALL